MSRDYAKTRATREQTKQRHASMRCQTRTLKISPRTAPKREYLKRLFAEGKWVYNDYLARHKAGVKWKDMPTTDTYVSVHYPDHEETRYITALSSGMKQGIQKRLRTNEQSMITNIKNGNITHGEMHYITQMNSLDLTAGNWEGDKAQVFTITRNKKRLKLQGYNHLLRIEGGHQIPDDAEIACGRLIRRANGNYYLQVTFYTEWETTAQECKDKLQEDIRNLVGTGFDFGIETNVTLSSGEKFNWYFEETERLKKSQAANEAYRAWHRRAFGWAASSKRQVRIMNEEYEKMRRRKEDAVNQFIGLVRKLPGYLVVQDEQVKSWHADERYSDMVHHSILGGLMKRLKNEPSTLVVSKWCRTTGCCPSCGHVLDERLVPGTREWDCPDCGAHHDRDVAAAGWLVVLGAVMGSFPDYPCGLDQEVFGSAVRALSGCGGVVVSSSLSSS